MERGAPQAAPFAALGVGRRPRVVAADDCATQRSFYRRAVLPVCADVGTSCVLGGSLEEAQRIVQVVLGRVAPDGTEADMAPADVVVLDQVSALGSRVTGPSPPDPRTRAP